MLRVVILILRAVRRFGLLGLVCTGLGGLARRSKNINTACAFVWFGGLNGV